MKGTETAPGASANTAKRFPRPQCGIDLRLSNLGMRDSEGERDFFKHLRVGLLLQWKSQIAVIRLGWMPKWYGLTISIRGVDIIVSFVHDSDLKLYERIVICFRCASGSPKIDFSFSQFGNRWVLASTCGPPPKTQMAANSFGVNGQIQVYISGLNAASHQRRNQFVLAYLRYHINHGFLPMTISATLYGRRLCRIKHQFGFFSRWFSRHISIPPHCHPNYRWRLNRNRRGGPCLHRSRISSRCRLPRR